MFRRLFGRETPPATSAAESAAAPPPVPENINEIFLTAVKNNDVKKVKALIGRVDVNMVDPSEYNATPLIISAARHYNNMLLLLLGAGADINKQTSNGDTALILAAHYGNMEIVDILLSNGANPNIKNNQGFHAIAHSIGNNRMIIDMYILKRLVAAGADLNLTFGDGTTPLIYTVFHEKIDKLKLLLDAGANINGKSQTNLQITPLIRSVYNDKKICKLLLDRGADINLADKDGNTPLMHAISNKKIDIVKLLITAGVNIDTKKNNGATALILAVLYNNIDIVKLLIDSGANINIKDNNGKTALIHAILNNNDEIVKLLLDSGANNNLADNEGNTPLIYAVNANKINVVKLLITAGANLDSKGQYGSTALIVAVKKKYNDIVQLLIESGANANIKGNDDYTPLKYALVNNDVEVIKTIITALNKLDTNNTAVIDVLTNMMIANNLEKVKLLIDLGANVNSKNKFGQSPLAIALSNNRFGISNLLITSGANVNALDNNNKTPLHIVASSQHISHSNQIHNKISVAKSLIDAGADVNIKDKDGDTPLMSAILSFYNSHFEMINLLIQHGADINTINNRGYTPLMFLTDNNYSRGVKLLLAAGADVSKQAPDGTTALYIAAKKVYEGIVKILLEKNPELTPKIQEAINERSFKPNIRKILVEHYKLDATTLWKGKSKSNIEMFDTIFADEASMSNYSFCPICLGWIPRADGCMYMNHNCTNMPYYNEELYEKYKNREGTISWCTICGRICAGHYHYPVVSVDAPRPRPLVFGSSDPFEKDCRISNGGGGLPEKFARIRQFRETALRLQSEVGKIKYEEAMDTLVKECWNAALKATNNATKQKVQTIMNEKKWNTISASNFHANVVQTQAANAAANAPNANDPTKYSAPIILSPGAGAAGSPNEGYEGNSVSFADDIPVIVFRHKDKEGNEHIHSQIGKDSLLQDLGDLGAERRGVCFECTGFLYPREIEMAFADPKMASTITENDRAKLATYKRWFNKWRAEDVKGTKGGLRITKRHRRTRRIRRTNRTKRSAQRKTHRSNKRCPTRQTRHKSSK